MSSDPGAAIYFVACTLSVLIVFTTLASFVYNVQYGEPTISVTGLVLAALIWLAGWAGRRLFAEE
jgi:uncharacterized membrane protein